MFLNMTVYFSSTGNLNFLFSSKAGSLVLVKRSKIKKSTNCSKTTFVSIISIFFNEKNVPYIEYFRSQNIALVRKLKEIEIEDDGLTTLDEAIKIFYQTLQEFLSHPALTLEFKRN